MQAENKLFEYVRNCRKRARKGARNFLSAEYTITLLLDSDLMFLIAYVVLFFLHFLLTFVLKNGHFFKLHHWKRFLF